MKNRKFQMTYATMSFEEVNSGLCFAQNFIRKHGHANARVRKFIRDAIKARFPVKAAGFKELESHYGK